MTKLIMIITNKIVIIIQAIYCLIVFVHSKPSNFKILDLFKQITIIYNLGQTIPKYIYLTNYFRGAHQYGSNHHKLPYVKRSY